MREFRKVPQNVQIRQLGKVVLCKYEGGEVRCRVRERGLYAVDAIAGKEEGVQARGKGEVGEGRDVVVGKVDGVLVLQRPLSSARKRDVGGLGFNATIGPLQRPNSQWRVFCGLHVLAIDINGAHPKV